MTSRALSKTRERVKARVQRPGEVKELRYRCLKSCINSGARKRVENMQIASVQPKVRKWLPVCEYVSVCLCEGEKERGMRSQQVEASCDKAVTHFSKRAVTSFLPALFALSLPSHVYTGSH